jgi:hypothetical protein
METISRQAVSLMQRGGSRELASHSASAHQFCLERANILMGSYRKGQASDPEMYVASIAAVLSEYPADVVTVVTDPRTGVQNRVKFLPEVYEVREACEIAMEPIRAEQRRALAARREQEVLAERRAYEAALTKPRPSYDDLKAKHGDNWGLNAEGTEAERERHERHMASIKQANRTIFERECAAAGIDPARGVSPSLLRQIEERRAALKEESDAA